MVHPIQLQFVAVRELTIQTGKPALKTYELPAGQIELGGSISPIIHPTREFQVSVVATVGDPEFTKPEIPLYLRVDLVGSFIITKKEVTDDQAAKWATYAARFTLIPYLREQVAGLSMRAGFAPILIPLLQLPVPMEAIAPAQEELKS